MARGIHVRYIGDGVHAVRGLGVFQTGTTAWAPRDVAIDLIRSGLFEAVSGGPTAQAFIVRVENTLPPPGPRDPNLPQEAADFERELEEEERRLAEEANASNEANESNELDQSNPSNQSNQPGNGKSDPGSV